MAERASRQCPMCGNDNVCSVQEARAVFGSLSSWGATSMLEEADLVCSVCRSVRYEETGGWDRMESVSARARELSQASSTKSKSDYRDVLTVGDDVELVRDPEPDAGSAAGADERESVGGAEW